MRENYQEAANSTNLQRARESCYKFSKERSDSLQQRSIPLAKYDGAHLSLRHFKSKKKFGGGRERIPVKYAIVTATVKLEPRCCRLFSIDGYLALILFTVTIPFQWQDVVNHSELRYLKHFISSSLSRSCETITWMQFQQKLVYEAFPYSENIVSFNYQALKTQFLLGFIFISGKNFRAPSRAVLNSSLHLCP